MFFLEGFDASITNILALTAPFRDPAQRPTAEVLQQSHRRFLASAQGQRTDHLPAGPTYVQDEGERARISTEFGRLSADSDVQRYAAAEEADDPVADAELVRAGIRSLREGHPALGYLLDILVHTIVSTVPPRSPGSGSLPPQMGVIYINPGPGWDATAVRECLLHELTHMLVSVDEFRRPHHPDTRTAWGIGEIIPTAVTGRPRSLNISFQSVIVAAELLSLRSAEGREGGVHGSDAVVADAALRACSSILALPALEGLATARFLELLGAAEVVLAARGTATTAAAS